MKIEYKKLFKNRWFLISLSAILLVTYIIFTGPDKSELKRFENIFNQDKSLNQYFDSEVEIVQSDSRSLNDYTFLDYTIIIDVNDKFGQLTNDEKYYVLLDGIHLLKKSINYMGGGDFESGDGYISSFKGITMRYDNKTYSMLDFEKNNEDYLYSMVINGKEEYQPQEQSDALNKKVEKSLAENNSNNSNNNYSSYINLTSSEKSEIWGFAKYLIEQRLKSPKSADFPWYKEEFVNVSGGQIIVSAYVDAENSYGAKLRKSFTVRLDKNKNVLSVNISGE